MNGEKIFGFMDMVNRKQESEKSINDYHNSIDYKLKVAEREQQKAKDVCLSTMFTKLFKDAVPLSGEYKNAYDNELEDECKGFIKDRCPNGAEFYFKEAIKKGSCAAKHIVEGVDSIVKDIYHEKCMQVKSTPSDEFLFKMSDDTQKKLDVLYQDLGMDDLSSIIHDNVKQSALSEISRAKKEKENQQQLEKELADDMKITNESALNKALELKGVKAPKIFQPRLFQGIMMSNASKVSNLTDVPLLYESMDIYKSNDTTIMEKASTEDLEKELADAEDALETIQNDLKAEVAKFSIKSSSEKEEKKKMISKLQDKIKSIKEKLSKKCEKDCKPVKESVDTLMDLAFVESVKEYTRFNVVRALELEKLTPSKIKEIANHYAENK